MVSEGEDDTGAAGVVREGARFLQRRGHRLVADDVDAGVEEGVGRGGMEVVRRDDAARLYAVGARRLLARHASEVGVGACDAERLGGAGRPLGRRRQRAGDKCVAVVEARRDAVHGANEGSLAAAHHAEPDAPALVLGCYAPLLPDAQQAPVARLVGFRARKVVEGALCRAIRCSSSRSASGKMETGAALDGDEQQPGLVQGAP